MEMSLDKSLKLPKGTVASLGSDLLGTASISLNLGKQTDGFHAVGDTVPGHLNAGMMAALSENLLPAVNSVVPKIDTLLTNLNTLVADPPFRRVLNASMASRPNSTLRCSRCIASRHLLHLLLMMSRISRQMSTR